MNVFFAHVLHTKDLIVHGQMQKKKKKSPKMFQNGFPFIASVMSHWSTPENILALIRTMKSPGFYSPRGNGL